MCADRELIITAGNNGQFRKLVEVLGVPELADDPRFARNEDRTAHRDELRPLLVERLSRRPAMDWFREIIAAGVPCGPINTVAGGVGFATEIGLDPVVEVGEGEAMVPSIRHPITFSETPADYRRPPPGLDEHGAEIRRWLSGEGGFETGAKAPSSTTGSAAAEASSSTTGSTAAEAPSSTTGSAAAEASSSTTGSAAAEAPSSTTGSPGVEEVALRPLVPEEARDEPSRRARHHGEVSIRSTDEKTRDE
jgi:hypothetical protein